MTKPSSKLRGVTFDMDGTLYDLATIRRKLGLSALFNLKFLFAYTRTREEMRRGGPYPDFHRLLYERLAGKLKSTPDKMKAKTERLIYGKWYKIMDRARPFPYLEAVLDTLVEMDVALGVISEYPVQRKLEGLGLGRYPWKSIVITEEMGMLKPHPRPFLRAARELGLEPGEILHIGDREDCDVEGALAAGFQAALILPRGKYVASRAPVLLNGYKDFFHKVPQSVFHKDHK